MFIHNYSITILETSFICSIFNRTLKTRTVCGQYYCNKNYYKCYDIFQGTESGWKLLVLKWNKVDSPN